jgi:hypothetical protein
MINIYIIRQREVLSKSNLYTFIYGQNFTLKSKRAAPFWTAQEIKQFFHYHLLLNQYYSAVLPLPVQ